MSQEDWHDTDSPFVSARALQFRPRMISSALTAPRTAITITLLLDATSTANSVPVGIWDNFQPDPVEVPVFMYILFLFTLWVHLFGGWSVHVMCIVPLDRFYITNFISGT